MAAIFVLILVSVFHGFASGCPSKGMPNIINIFFFLLFLHFFLQFILFRGINHGIISYSCSRLGALTLIVLAKP